MFVFCALFTLTWGNTQYAGTGHGGGDLCYVPRHTKIVALTELPPSYGLQDNVAFLNKGASIIIECESTDAYTKLKTSYLKAFKCDGHSQMYASCRNKGIELTERNLLVLYKEEHTPHEAERQCLLKGGTMASITGAAENSMAVSLMAYAHVQTALIGLTDRFVEGYYMWMDGSNSRWSNWYKGYPRYSTPQPNNHGMGEDYVVIQREGANGRWFDVGPPRTDSPLSTFERTGNNSFSFLCKFAKITFTKEGYQSPNYNNGCPGGSIKHSCVNKCSPLTCHNSRRCYSGRYFPCIEGCACPDNLPVVNGNRCITKAQCSAPEPPAPKCEAGKEWLECPSVCTATCADPRPTCTKHCGEPGCVCPAILHEGQCIEEEKCPKEPQCSGGQVYNSCANACSQQTCTDLFQVCAFTDICEGGCRCPSDRPFLHQGQCITRTKCDRPGVRCYRPGRTYQTCTSDCTATCESPNPVCTKQCVAKCACPPERPLEYNGRCVTLNQCPRPTCSGGQVYSSCANVCTQRTCTDRIEACADMACEQGCKCPTSKPYLDNGICLTETSCPSRCKGNQVYQSCAPICPKTCADPVPRGAICRSCASGCACPPLLPLLHNGRCIAERQCPGRQCDSNQVYATCGSSCTATCDKPNPACSRECVERCECPNYLPVLHQGTCIKKSSCPTKPTIRCTGGQVVDPCGNICSQRTCEYKREGCIADLGCQARCKCPDYRPYMYNGRCVTERQCPNKPQCENNLVYQTCARDCTASCDTPNPVCTLQCVAKCVCPYNLPILHEGRCIAQRSCPKDPECENNLVYSTCGSSCTATCDDPTMSSCTGACVAKCVCPNNLPVLHKGRCIAASQCPDVTSTGQCRGSVTSYRDDCDRHCTCKGAKLDYCCRERKAFSSLTSREKTRLLRAMVTITSDPVYRPEWIRLTKIHVNNFKSDIHTAAQFFPWHREYLYLYEDLLRKVDCKITLPYWDWTKEQEGTIYGSDIFSTFRGFGGDGSGFTRCISGAYFSSYRLSNNGCIKRSFQREGNCAAKRWPTISQMKKLVKGQPNQAKFEAFIRGVWHNTIHNCFGKDSTLRGFNSAEEPLFVLHHAMVDYAWWSWQSYHGDNTFPHSNNRLIGFSNKRVSSVLVSERMRGEEGVCYRPQPERDLTSEEFQQFQQFQQFQNFGQASGRTFGSNEAFVAEEGCAMDPEDTLADTLTQEELQTIADMNELLGLGSNC